MGEEGEERDEEVCLLFDVGVKCAALYHVVSRCGVVGVVAVVWLLWCG